MSESQKIEGKVLKTSKFGCKIHYHASALRDDGSVVIVGGDDYCTMAGMSKAIVWNRAGFKIVDIPNGDTQSTKGGAVFATKDKVYSFGGVMIDDEAIPSEFRSLVFHLNGTISLNVEEDFNGTWEVPSASLVGHTWTKIGTKGYLFGGKFKDRFVAGVWSFDPEKNLWEYIHCKADEPSWIPSTRYFHQACAHKDELLIFGGMAVDVNQKLIYRFDTKEKRFLKPYALDDDLYKNGIAEGAMCTIGDLVLICGGRVSGKILEFITDEVRDVVSDSFVVYDIQNKTCITNLVVDGIGSRAGHTMHTIGQYVLIIGGDVDNSSAGDIVCVSSDLFDQQSVEKVEAFDILEEKESIPRDPYPSKKNLFDSLIIDFKQGLQLNTWYGVKLQKWKLLYRGTVDGFGSTQWHAKVDHKGPTITIIKTNCNGSIFGGFTPIPWDSSGADKSDTKTWIFSLKNPHDSNCYQFKKIANTTERSVYHSGSYHFWVGNNDVSIEQKKLTN